MSEPTIEDRLSQALRERDRLRRLIREAVAFRRDHNSNAYCCGICDAATEDGAPHHARNSNDACPWPALVAAAEVSP